MSNTSDETNNPMFLESVKATIVAGQSAMKSALLINGGGAIALLAYFGSPAFQNDAPSSLFLWAMGCFCAGLLFAAAAQCFTYLVQSADSDRILADEDRKQAAKENQTQATLKEKYGQCMQYYNKAKKHNLLAIIMMGLSLLVFCGACISASIAFRTQQVGGDAPTAPTTDVIGGTCSPMQASCPLKSSVLFKE